MARHFNGTTDYLGIGTGVRGTDLHGVLAMCWVNLDESTVTHTAMARYHNGSLNSQWALIVSPGGVVAWVILDSALTGHALSGGTITTGSWHHIAGMYDGATMYVYVDGVATTQTISVALNDNVASMPVYLGRQDDGNYFAGHLAECTLSLVNTAVNPAANYQQVIIANSQTAATPECDGIYDTEQIDYWPLLGDSPEPTYGIGFDIATVHGTTVTPHPYTSSILSLGRARALATGSSVA